MASTIPHISPPVDVVYRVNRRGRTPFEQPDWELAGEERKFSGRYDDPAGTSIPERYRFRTLYCGSTSAASLGETIYGKGLCPDLETIAKCREAATLGILPPELRKFRIVEEWRASRHLERATLDASLRFADIEADETLHILRNVPHLAEMALEVSGKGKLQEFDRSALYGPHEFTQHIARYIYEQIDAGHHPKYDGIHFTSRLNNGWECWAVFDTRIQLTVTASEPILYDHPGLREAARVLHMPIEAPDGRLICPWLPGDDCGD
jgi:hypothetical protein